MSDYKRTYVPGGGYFFTVVTKDRRPLFDSEYTVGLLRRAFQAEMNRRPFEIEAMVVLPDHLHCIWRLPEHDMDFSSRWREIKKYVSRHLGPEKTVWQPRFWEHLIRDQVDWRRHLDYIHYNPVRHGLVQRPRDWRHSSFRRAVARGWYLEQWGDVGRDIQEMDLE